MDEFKTTNLSSFFFFLFCVSSRGSASVPQPGLSASAELAALVALQRDQQLQSEQLHQQAAAFAAASASYEQQLFFASLAAAGAAAAAGGAQAAAAAASPGNRGLSPMEMDAIATVAAAVRGMIS
jgi:hypothetical protein